MKKQALFIIVTVLLVIALMAPVELVWQPGYPVKSLVKLLLFAGGVGVYVWKTGSPAQLRQLFSLRSLKPALVLGAGVFGVILLAWFLFRSFIDLESIAAGLLEKEGIGAGNFLWVALYISVVNSLLEELFFRGFAYLTLRRHWDEGLANLFSAGAFALYHVSILRGWFSWWIYGLCMAGLIIGGLIFNALDREGGLFPSWIVHGAANLAINTIGLIMFQML